MEGKKRLQVEYTPYIDAEFQKAYDYLKKYAKYTTLVAKSREYHDKIRGLSELLKMKNALSEERIHRYERNLKKYVYLLAINDTHMREIRKTW